jgi:hypothetical protein
MAYPQGVRVLEQPDLDSPVLLVMLSGWIDAAGAAAAAMQSVELTAGSRTIATFEPDLFIDYRARRPVMQLREGVSSKLVWPSIELKVGHDDAGNDLLLLTGFEPDANWQFFAKLVADVCTDLGVRMMVGLGAYPFAAPHTRPCRLSCTTPSGELASSVRYLRNSADVPAGIESVLEHAFHTRGTPAIGLWVQVPHYISTTTYPAASAALLEGVAETASLSFDISALVKQASVQRDRLDELVDANPEHVAMLRQLETAWDATEEATGASRADLLDPDQLPSGDELAAEVEQFLRDQDG